MNTHFEIVNRKSPIVNSVWEGCYEGQWSGVISPQSFSHPAKFSRGLIERIYDHCLAQGYLQRGDLVGDPFGGIGTGGITAAYRGLLWVGVELEPRFVKLGQENFALHKHRWARLLAGDAMLLQGDSRAFHTVLRTATSGVVTSPPYADSISAKASGIDWAKGTGGRDFTKEARHEELRKPMALEYGFEPGQIGALKSGPLDGVMTSPPYAGIAAGAGGLNSKPAQKAGQQTGRAASSSQTADQRYGAAEGQIARLAEGTIAGAVTSPPYADSIHGGGTVSTPRGDTRYSDSMVKKYYKESGQIGELPSGKLDGIATSPPYVDSNGHPSLGHPENDGMKGGDILARATTGAARGDEIYGNTSGQIGNERKETYWEAMRAVYGSCFVAIKPGGVMAVVVKDYVARGARVHLCDDTARLLEWCGFRVVERVRAMLVHETIEGDLLAGDVTVRRERKSFFRRLAERKGSPRIDWEEVIFAVKPAGALGGVTEETSGRKGTHATEQADGDGGLSAKKSKESLSTH